jgi:ABC transporter with metal-binding/Fe-S-binding domain ATP-binding protein
MIATLFSGGKDSMLAMHRMHAKGRMTELLITMVSDNDFSYMFHKPNIDFTSLQAEALGIRQLFATTKGEKERELDDLRRVFKENNVTELITGAVASVYQKERIEAICRDLSITLHSPIWHIDPMEELAELSSRYNVIVTQIAAEGMEKEFLGARINKAFIDKLLKIQQRYRINLLFEGGEAESFVLDAPLFKKSIGITKRSTEFEGSVGRFIIEDAILEDKMQ